MSVKTNFSLFGRRLLGALCVGLSLFSAASVLAQPWDLATDYSNANNPNGVWTYGIDDFFGSFQILPGNTSINGINDYFGTDGPAWTLNGTLTPSTPGISQAGPSAAFDLPEGRVGGHDPAPLDGNGLTFRWTAPNTEVVSVDAGAWNLTVQPEHDARLHGYQLRHNGSVISTGPVLNPAQGFTSANPSPIKFPSVSVTAGDTLDLAVYPLEGNGGGFMGVDFTVNQGAAPTGVPNYLRSAASDMAFDYSGGLPQNNSNGDWTYVDGSDNLLEAGTVAASNQPGWRIDASTVAYGIFRGGWAGFANPSITGHTETKVVWTAPADIDLGGVELTGFIQQLFEPDRQLRLQVFKNDEATPEVFVDAAPASATKTSLPVTQVPIAPGDTLTIYVDGSGATGNGVNTFGAWDLIIKEIELVVTGLDGDYNENDVIDAADYTVWRDALTAGSSSLPNDPTPGTVDESDFTYWRDHFGDVLGSGAGVGSVAVPEPGSLFLFLVGIATVAGLRRRGASSR